MSRREETGLFGPLSQAIELRQHPELRRYSIGSTAADRQRASWGMAPLELKGDSYHLNRFGYLIVATAIAEKLRALGWY